VARVGIARRRLGPELRPITSAPDPVALLRAVDDLAENIERVRDHIAFVDDQLSRAINEFAPARKAAVTGVAPSATANTYGPATDINPTDGYSALETLVHIALTSGGTFGAETLSVRVTAKFSDGTTASVEKTFVATGGETALTNAELHDMMKEGVGIYSLAIDAKSTIPSSTATGGAKVGAING
jgi:hypothetical protein